MTFVKNQAQRDADLATTAAITAVAAASNTPFKTAFKISMGIAMAQLAVLGIFVLGFATVVGIITYLVKHG